jgi:hypoxanthine phosphoribosyltransferase
MDMAVDCEFEVCSWRQIYRMLLVQAKKIQLSNFKPDVIVAIARGGLVPARIHMDLLETKNYAAIQIEHYMGINQTAKEPILKQCLNAPLTGKRALLVDDISDGGKSLKIAKAHLQEKGAAEVKTATLYVKPQTCMVPDFFEKSTCKWVVFPWDIKETVRTILQQQKNREAADEKIGKLVKAGLPKQLAEKFLKDMQ